MLRNLTVKYLVVFVIVSGLSVYVTLKDEPALLAKQQTLAWHVFFSWPGGITVWAVFCTLFAIGEQSNETRRSARYSHRAAEAALKQVELANEQMKMTKRRERARLTITPQLFKAITVDNLWDELEIKVENVGYSHAFNLRFDARFEITMSDREPEDARWETASINIVRVGEEPRAVSISLSASKEMWNNVIHAGAKDLFMHLWGTARYEDVFGELHVIRFQYVFSIKKLGEEVDQDGLAALPIDAGSRMHGWRKCSHPEHNTLFHNPARLTSPDTAPPVANSSSPLPTRDDQLIARQFHPFQCVDAFSIQWDVRFFQWTAH